MSSAAEDLADQERAYSSETEPPRKKATRRVGRSTYPCLYTDCGKSFKQLTDLQNHIRTHTGEKPYHCGVAACLKKFATNSQLRRHERTHTKERPCTCSFRGCGKKFRTSSHLKRHFKSHHSGSSSQSLTEAPSSSSTAFVPYSAVTPSRDAQSQDYQQQSKSRPLIFVPQPYPLQSSSTSPFLHQQQLQQHQQQLYSLSTPFILPSLFNGFMPSRTSLSIREFLQGGDPVRNSCIGLPPSVSSLRMIACLPTAVPL